MFFSDGWEKLGLYEYFRAKQAAKKQKELVSSLQFAWICL